MSVSVDPSPFVTNASDSGRRRAIALYVTALMLLVASIVWTLRGQYLAEVERVEQRLDARAEVVEALVAEPFDVATHALAGLLALDEMINPAGNGPPMAPLLRERTRSLPLVEDLAILSDPTSAEARFFEGWLPQDAFLRQLAGLRRGETLVSSLHYSPSAGEYRMTLVQRSTAETTQMHVAMASIDPRPLAEAIKGFGLMQGESIALVDSEARLVVRVPAAGLAPGELVSQAGSRSLTADAPDTLHFRQQSPLDGQERLFVARRVAELPLWLVLGYSHEALLSGWSQRLWPLVVLGALLALLGLWLLRHVLAQGRAQLVLQGEVVERQRAEQAAHRREARLKALIGSMQDLVLVLDRGGHFSFVHAGDEALLLAPPEVLVGSHYRAFLPPDIARRLDGALAEVAASGEVRRFDYSLTVGGGPRDFSALISPLLSGDGEHDGVLLVVRDVTLERLHQANMSIAAVAFETHLGMMITDVDGRILKVNRTFTDITGYREDEVQGSRPDILRSGRHDEHFYRQLWQRIGDTGAWQGEIWNRRKSGDIYPQWLTISAVRDERGQLRNYVATLSDITERKAAEEEIHQLAFFDPLTGLANRRLLLDRLGEKLERCQRDGCYGALLLIDFDNFKQVNDTLGHHGGDELLREAARRFESVLREEDTLARLSADEFVVVLEGVGVELETAVRVADTVARKLLNTLDMPVWIEGRPVSPNARVGISPFRDEVSRERLLQQADMALFQAKSQTASDVCFFDPGMQRRMQQRAQLYEDLLGALARSELYLVYQKQVDQLDCVTGVEALIRWRHPDRGLVPPSEFIPLAEERPLIHELGLWVIEQACLTLVDWVQQGDDTTRTVSVNVSPRQFQDPGFVARVSDILARTGAPARRLKLEVTESLFVADRDGVERTMTRLKALGVTFALDDFGTGYSSLAYLKRLPLDELKIDQSFVRDVLDNATSSAIVASTIALARSLGLDVIAEGVESAEQRDWLHRHGCHRYQGFLYGQPAPLSELDFSTL